MAVATLIASLVQSHLDYETPFSVEHQLYYQQGIVRDGT